MTSDFSSTPDSFARPQLNPEAILELGNSPHVRPDLAIEDAADRGMVHAGALSHGILSPSADARSELDRELTRGLPDGVRGGDVRPALGEVAGSRTSGSHDARLEDPPAKVATAAAHVGTVLNFRYSNSNVCADVTRFIRGYTPRMDRVQWAAISEFCRSCVTDFGPDTLVKAKHIMGVVKELAHWANTRGLDLNREDIFDQSLVLMFLEQFGEHQDRTRQTLLTEVARRLSGIEPLTDIRVGRGSLPHAPYSPAQVAQFYGWARGQASERYRHNAMAILSLMVGAGLSCVELRNLTVGDIIATQSSADLRVGGRVVPVLDSWAADVYSLVNVLKPRDRVFVSADETMRPSAVVGQFLRGSRGLGPKPTAARLRATWMVQQLVAGTPLDVLLEASGFNDARSLERYLPFVHRDPMDAAASLRNARRAEAAR